MDLVFKACGFLTMLTAWGVPMVLLFLAVDCLNHINRRLAELGRILEKRP